MASRPEKTGSRQLWLTFESFFHFMFCCLSIYSVVHMLLSVKLAAINDLVISLPAARPVAACRKCHRYRYCSLMFTKKYLAYFVCLFFLRWQKLNLFHSETWCRCALGTKLSILCNLSNSSSTPPLYIQMSSTPTLQASDDFENELSMHPFGN